MKRFVVLSLIGLALAAQTSKKRPATSQPKPAPPPASSEYKGLQEFPIATLKVEGNETYTEKAVVVASGLKVGENANKQIFEAARDRLLATGAFDSVGYRYFNGSDGKSYDAVFQIVEAIPLYPFRFDDTGASPQELEQLLRSKDPLYGSKIPATKLKIDSYKSIVEEYLAAKKDFKGTIAGKVEADAPEKLSIVFRPAGSLPVISDVRFTGNTTIPTAMLKPAISGVAVGVPFNESRFRQLLDTSIKPLYEARGRLKVKFPTVKVEPSKEVKGLDVSVAIDEGPVFNLGEVNLQGRDIPTAELQRAADFKPGDVANMTSITEGVDRMRDHLRRQGYLMAVTTPERHLDDAKNILNLLVDVEMGPQYTFRSLKIEGLDIESEPVIRKMWGMEEGKPVNPDYPKVFLTRVREQEIFENLGETRSTQNIDEPAKAVDVTLIFGKAAKRGSILK